MVKKESLNQLSSKNKEIFLDISNYLNRYEMSQNELEMIQTDLLEIFVSAQNRNENLEDVIGDKQEFADSLYENMDKLPKTETSLRKISSSLFLVGVITLIPMIETIIFKKSSVSYKLSLLILLILLSLFIFIFNGWLKEKMLNKKSLTIFLLAFTPSIIIQLVDTLIPYTVFNLSILQGLFLSIGLIILGLLIQILFNKEKIIL